MFPPAYFEFLERGGKALMLFSEKDRLQSEYEEKFARAVRGATRAVRGADRQTIVIANANHVLTLHEWQREMVASRAWTRKYFHAA